MNVNLLTKHRLESLSLKGGCTGWSESILVKMPHCLKSHVMAHIYVHVFIDIDQLKGNTMHHLVKINSVVQGLI